MKSIQNFGEFIKESEGFLSKVYNFFLGGEEWLKKPASLFFDGKELHWVVDGQTKKSWDAISGNTVTSTLLNKRHDKSSATHGNKFQKDKSEGPLPEGKYYVERLQEQNRKDNSTLTQYYNYMFGDDKERTNFHGSGGKFAWGDYRMLINIPKGTNTYGRDSFYIHGGSIAGSSGCIDLTDEMEDFAKTYLSYLTKTKQPKLALSVKYKNK
jgi:hypothetical protein